MSFWRDHGVVSLTVLAVAVIVFDPVNRFLPVPMAPLHATRQTVWLPGIPVVDGRMEQGPAVDRYRDAHDPIVSNARDALARIVGADVLASEHPVEPLASFGAPPGWTTPTDAGGSCVGWKAAPDEPSQEVIVWADRLVAQRNALTAIPTVARLRAPWDAGLDVMTVPRAPNEQLRQRLWWLGMASRIRARVAIVRCDHDAAQAEAIASAELARLSPGLGSMEDAILSIRLRSSSLHVLIDAIAAGVIADVAEVDAILERDQPWADVLFALTDGDRLVVLRSAASMLAQSRTASGARSARKRFGDAPPDPDRCLAEINAFYDVLAAEVAGAKGMAEFIALDLARLPGGEGIERLRNRGDDRPLANRLVFRAPVAQRSISSALLFAAVIDGSKHLIVRSVLIRATSMMRLETAIRLWRAARSGVDRDGLHALVPEDVDRKPLVAWTWKGDHLVVRDPSAKAGAKPLADLPLPLLPDPPGAEP
ncbi:MAG: hypothetical protein H0W83_06840 [Planctomycetes bacterium]|nr:hypothetical protein [Planctomycetota bacterium]